MHSAALRITRTSVVIVACSVVQDSEALEIADTLTKLADRVAIVTGQVVYRADAARRIAPDPEAEALAHGEKNIRCLVSAGEMRTVRGIDVVAGRIHDQPDTDRPADTL